LTAC